MTTSPDQRTRSPRKYGDVPSGSGDVTSSSGLPNIRQKRPGAGEAECRLLELALRRERSEEGLGMVMVLEEDLESPSGRRVLVKSLTPGGAAARARHLRSSPRDDVATGPNDDVTSIPEEEDDEAEGFRIGDRVLQIDEHVLDAMGEEDCLDVLQDIPQHSVMLVQRAAPSPAKTARRLITSASSSSASAATTTTKPSTSVHASSLHHSDRLSAAAKLPGVVSLGGGTLLNQAATDSGSAEESSGRFPMTMTTAGGGGGGGRTGAQPRPAPRKVRRQMSTAAHLAEKGLPGFLVRRVTVCRQDGQSLGLSIVPSCGVTKFYYQVRRLLPSGVCGGSPGLQVGDRLLECNGLSLQGLTQARCLDLLKAAGPRVTLTVLREKEGRQEPQQQATAREEKSGASDSLGEQQQQLQHQQRLPRVVNTADLKSSKERKEGECSSARVGVDYSPAELPPNQKEGDVQRGVDPVNGASVSLSEDTRQKRDAGPVAVPPRLVPRTGAAPSRSSGKSSSSSSSRSQDGGVTQSPASRHNPLKGQSSSPSAAMSNPFFDLDPLAPEEGGQSHSGQDSGDLCGLDSANPFYTDVVFGGGQHPDFSAISTSNPFYDDVVMGGGEEGGGEEHGGDGVGAEDVLLDLAEEGEGGGGGGRPPTFTFPAGGAEDFLCSSSSAGELHAGIPPPMAFCNLGHQESSPAQPPPASNQDLLDLAVVGVVTAVKRSAGKASPDNGFQSGGTNGPENSLDFLLDADEAKRHGPALLMEVAEEEQEAAKRSEDIGSSPCETRDSGKESVLQSSLPGNLVRLTSMGLANKLLTTSTTRSEQQEEEEEEITPMAVHRDHQGNKLAAPSSRDGSAKPLSAPRKLDEAAKLDLQNVMSRMTTKPRRTQAPQNGSEDGPRVMEEEIVPVKLTRKEAETATGVLSKWTSGQSKTLAFTPSSSSTPSGFQKVVGSVLDVQAGRSELPANSVFLTTMGVTRAPTVGQRQGEEGEEEEITPMSLHRDHLGNKHFAPSTLRSGVKLTAPRQVDPAAKLDIAALLLAMPARGQRATVEDQRGSAVEEDVITATVLSKSESRIAMEAVSRWLSKGSETTPQTTPSAFQRLVNNVMDSAPKADPDEAAVVAVAGGGQPQSEPVEGTFTSSVQASAASSPLRSQRTQPAPTAAADEEENSRGSQHQRYPPPPTKLKPQPPPVMPKPSLAEREKVFDERDHILTTTTTTTASEYKAPTPKKPTDAGKEPNTTTTNGTTIISTTVTSTTTGTTDLRAPLKDPKPVPSQRTLRGQGRIASLSQNFSLSGGPVKPLSKIGTRSLTPGSRSGTPAMLTPKVPLLYSSLSSSSSAAHYGKERSEEQPFLVEVLKGIVGLGIKVKVTDQGYVEVTEVQRNSPVAKNGNVRVGDCVLSVNGTELQALSEGRVQQVLRLLPRGLVKLVISAQPPPESQQAGAEQRSAGQASPRSGASFSQYGVRLNPRPFSPTTTTTTPSSDGQPPSSTHSHPPAASESQRSGESPLSAEEEEEEDEDEMSTRKLSKALSPRTLQDFTSDPPDPPKPTPRHRPAPLSPPTTPTADSKPEAARESAAEDTPKKAERNLTVTEVVAAASRRPSGRDDDLPQPPDPVFPQGEVTVDDDDNDGEVKAAGGYQAPPSHVDTVLHVSRTASGVPPSALEDAPVFAAAAKNATPLSPIPTPRPKARSSSSEDGLYTAPRERGGMGREEEDRKKAEDVEETLQAHSAHVSHAAAAAPSPPVSVRSKIPPPVAPKPKRTSSVSSDNSSAMSDETPRDPASPISASSKLKDFADAAGAGAPAVEDPSHNRKFVSSAARMFERKATEVKPVSPLTRATRSSVPVSSVVKSFNRGQDSEPPSGGKSEVVMRRVGVGVGGGGGGEGEDGKRLNIALQSASERRKSMPSRFMGSSSLTKPSSLSHLRHQPPGRGGPAISEEEGETADKGSPRFNSALKPRHAFPAPSSASSSSSFKSILTPRSLRETKADRPSDVTLKSRPSETASPRDVTSLKHQSWSSQTSSGGDPHSPRMVFTSSSLHHQHTPHHGTSSSSATHSWGADHSDQLESNMKKFDDLLSDKHTLDSDEELPQVSNSLSLDLLKNRTAGKVAVSMELSHQPAESSAPTATSTPEGKEDSVGTTKSRGEERSEKTKAASLPADEAIAPATDVSRRGVSGFQKQVQEDSVVASVQAAASTAPSWQSESPRVQLGTNRSQKADTGAELVENSEQKKHDEGSKANDALSEPARTQLSPEEQQPQRQPRKSRAVVKEEEDSCPEADAADPIHVSATEERGEDSAPVNVSVDSYPAEDAALPRNVAEETLFQQQASSIVHTVVTNALRDVTSRPTLPQTRVKEEEEEEEEEEEDIPPPPLPSKEPPPLPGAPPPPLILRNMAETLTPAEHLEGMLPSESSTSAKSSPRSQPRLTSSSSDEVSPRSQPGCLIHVLESGDVQVEIEETVSADTAAPTNLALQQQQQQQKEEDTEVVVRDSDVLLTFQSPQSPPPAPLSGGEGVPGKSGLLDAGQEEVPPVSDTLSQDSGVQDEDMSEDGLRFSHDDSPTSHSDPSSLFHNAITPDDLPPSLMDTQEVVVEVTPVAAVSKSPVSSPRAKVSSPSPRSPTPTSLPPRAERGGVPSSVDSQRRPSEKESLASVQKLVPQRDVQSAAALRKADSAGADSKNSVRSDRDNSKEDEVPHLPPHPPKTTPPPPPAQTHNDNNDTTNTTTPTTTTTTSPTEDDNEDSAMVKSSRKWSIVDQSGSLFLHGSQDSQVKVKWEALRQVSSLTPEELSFIMTAANRDLDEADVGGHVELRVVAARGLSGRTLSLEVTQRHDYLLQVTRVHSKDSALQEADLLLFVDVRAQKNRRPAQVLSQLETTGPKGILLTARGVKLPPSLPNPRDDRTSESSDSNSESPRSVSTPTSTSTSPAVQVGPGLYDVIMVKGVTGVGFCLEGGIGSPRGDLPILIKRIFKGGPAEKCGHLKVKDEIVAVNGVDFTIMRHYEAWNHLKFLDDGEIRLRIRRQED